MANPRHDWYLKHWLKTLGVSQQWVADELRQEKSKISRIATGVTPYTRDDVNAISALLHLAPYELLLPPERAMEIRSFDQAVRLVAEKRTDFTPAPVDLQLIAKPAAKRMSRRSK